MRGKRSKQYRKLMHQYGMHFGFREPYQVLLDAEILEVAARSKMNFLSMLSNTLHGEIKPMITQCCMRHLYDARPKNEMLIEHAKSFERRRCNHHTLEKPLSALECISSVVDPNGTKNNKHRYVVACQDTTLQQTLQTIPGVPIIYILRSVMIMKPMSDVTTRVTSREEQAKLSSGIRKSQQLNPAVSRKRKAADELDGLPESVGDSLLDDSGPRVDSASTEGATPVAKRKRKKGPKAPNPLSVRKPKKESSLPVQSLEGKSGSTRRKR